MSFKQFATCHCHPASLDSASTPAAFAERELAIGSGVITCTDHGTLQAAQKVYALGQKHGLIPVIGLEAYFRDDTCPILQKLGIPRTSARPKDVAPERWAATHPDGLGYFEYLKYMHLTMHFQDYSAYQCAVRLLSKADAVAELHGSETKALFSWSDIEELAAHKVTVTSSCLVGMVQRHIIHAQNNSAALHYFNRLKHLFGDRFFVEVFPHRCTHNYMRRIAMKFADGTESLFYFEKKLMTSYGEMSAEALVSRFYPADNPVLLAVKKNRKWDECNKPIVAVERKEGLIQNECSPLAPDGDVQYGGNLFVLGQAKRQGIKVLIGDDSHFALPEEKIVQDVRLAQMGDWRFANSYHRQTSDEAWSYFRDHMGIEQSVFEGWVENSQEWAASFKGFQLDTSVDLPTGFYPSDTLRHTKELIKKHGRMNTSPEYLDRLRQELTVLHKNGSIDLLPYFHLAEEICSTYERQGVLTGPGRGSAAGLYLSYLLGITHIDPIKYGLSSERFITVDRIKSGKLPDIDQDLPDRSMLVGQDTDVVEFTTSDGETHILPASYTLETDQGLLTAEQAFERGAEVREVK